MSIRSNVARLTTSGQNEIVKQKRPNLSESKNWPRMTDLMQNKRSWRAEGTEVGRKSPGSRPVGDFGRTRAPRAGQRDERSNNVAINSAKSPAHHNQKFCRKWQTFVYSKN